MDVCPVQAFATGLSLVQRSPTKYLNNITKPPACGGQGPYKDCRATDGDGDEDDDDDSILLSLVLTVYSMIKAQCLLPFCLIWFEI
jgi:hypothetical protein